MRYPKEKKNGVGRSLKRTSRFQLNQKRYASAGPLARWPNSCNHSKKNLTKKYIKTGTTPVFTGELEKLRGHWDAFVQYKSSELGLQKV